MSPVLPQIFTYDGNEQETYYILRYNVVFAEIFAAEDVVRHLVDMLNISDIEETIKLFV